MSRRQPNVVARFLNGVMKWAITCAVVLFLMWHVQIDVKVNYRTLLPKVKQFDVFKMGKKAVEAVKVAASLL